MPTRHLKFIGAVSVALAICTSIPSAAAKKEQEIITSIQPGPVIMSEEEKAIEADPNTGAEHGIILVDETEHDDRRGLFPRQNGFKVLAPYFQTSFHRRAKILSREGRRLANVEISLYEKEATLVRWWGRTILPDGSIMEMPEDQLIGKSILKDGKLEIRSLRAALPGVEPGCVIDYGYVTRQQRFRPLTRVLIQQDWPVRRLRYQWFPILELRSGCTPWRRGGLDIQVERAGVSYVVSANNIPPLVREPLMPPDNETRSSVSLTYIPFTATSASYWDDLAKGIEEVVHKFTPTIRRTTNALEEIDLPPGADLALKLRRVYEWMGSNIHVTGLSDTDEVDVDPDEKDVGHGAFASVLSARKGSLFQVALTFLVLARAAGAEANLALAADRRDHDWNPSLISWAQFDEVLVAVKAPGEDDAKTVLAAPGSGLSYGEIPWWVAGGKAFVATATGHRETNLRIAPAVGNVSHISGTISFEEEGDRAQVRWSHSGSGQSGYLEKRNLLALAAEKRRTNLNELCGNSADFEVSRAEAEGIDEPAARWKYACEGLFQQAARIEGPDETSVRFDGPWMDPLPELISSERDHPVIFPFPKTEIDTMVVVAGHGFAPSAPPEPISIHGSFGAYSLSVSATAAGYEVQRELTLPLARVDSNLYPGLREFLFQVKQADRTRIRFVKTAGPPS